MLGNTISPDDTLSSKPQNETPSPPLEAEVRNSIKKVNSWPSEQQQQKAEGSFKEALSRSEDKNGLSSPSTLEVVKELARYYIKVNEYLKAELLYKRVFVAIQEQEGPWNPKTATILQLIAEAAVRQGHYVEATECLLRVEAIQKAAIGINHLETLSTRASIAI